MNKLNMTLKINNNEALKIESKKNSNKNKANYIDIKNKQKNTKILKLISISIVIPETKINTIKNKGKFLPKYTTIKVPIIPNDVIILIIN